MPKLIHEATPEWYSWHDKAIPGKSPNFEGTILLCGRDTNESKFVTYQDIGLLPMSKSHERTHEVTCDVCLLLILARDACNEED